MAYRKSKQQLKSKDQLREIEEAEDSSESAIRRKRKDQLHIVWHRSSSHKSHTLTA
jgi:hypothetical protein